MRRRIAGSAVKAAEVRRDHAPASLGERELTLPHPGIQGESVQENENAARSGVRARRRLEVAESAYGEHEPIVNVPPARVESKWGRKYLRPRISDVRTSRAPRARDSDRARIGCSRRPTRTRGASQGRWRRR